jgi:hypothetical protein
VGWVEGEFAQQFAGLGVDDADVAVRDEGDESFSRVLAAQTDVVEPAVVADGQDAGGVGAIASGSVVDRDRGFRWIFGRASQACWGVRRPTARWGRMVL